jgi:demethylmenaquinone methyltransferase/2-methoxy-6-polyprenyl-1,4-benzoquinol methylase
MTLPAPADKATAVRRMFDAIAPRYDLVNRVMTLGMDVSWRRATARALGLPRGSLVLDLACGTGDLCNETARLGLLPVGLDYSAGMLAAANTSAPLVQGDALSLPVRQAAADGVTCGFALRNVEDIAALFAQFARVIRPRGRVAILEVSQPRRRALRFGHHFYFHRVVPMIGGLLSDRAAYRYLPESVAYLPPTQTLLQMLGDAGFSKCESRSLGLGAAQLITGTRS